MKDSRLTQLVQAATSILSQAQDRLARSEAALRAIDEGRILIRKSIQPLATNEGSVPDLKLQNLHSNWALQKLIQLARERKDLETAVLGLRQSVAHSFARELAIKKLIGIEREAKKLFRRHQDEKSRQLMTD